MGVYILKSTAILAILMLFYKVFLERQSYHRFKRFYLLFALIASVTIPLITFIEFIEPVLDFGTYDLNSTNTPPYFPAEIITDNN
ncbi:MAG: hypothetical protein HKP48_09595 [Winogradskyella sp.]|uniref:hypothetical protein n=1 Tax=Winogradskyella sp. TaxID=1883156 RepID=UPI00184709EF|nr:hypothetical protein [Winogradskyella sp.]NNK23523.1 hypothetical protein [Winogradskyella sp.]